MEQNTRRGEGRLGDRQCLRLERRLRMVSRLVERLIFPLDLNVRRILVLNNELRARTDICRDIVDVEHPELVAGILNANDFVDECSEERGIDGAERKGRI